MDIWIFAKEDTVVKDTVNDRDLFFSMLKIRNCNILETVRTSATCEMTLSTWRF